MHAGRLKDRRGAELLLLELARLANSRASSDVLVAISICGDERAIDPLVRLVLDNRTQDATRAQAAAVLGVLADPEGDPSLARLTVGLNYRASTVLTDWLLRTL